MCVLLLAAIAQATVGPADTSARHHIGRKDRAKTHRDLIEKNGDFDVSSPLGGCQIGT
jgi:hypothetical protein